jgi:glutamate/tyrosine decarboxylase-like PLP-dependent enzyme
MPVFQINFSRPAGQIIAQYYNFLRLGHEGYRRIHQASYEIGQYLAAEIVKLGPFELLCDSNPDTGIPTVTWRIRAGEDPGYTPFRPSRPAAHPRMAGACLHSHRNSCRHIRAAHSGPPGREPGHGLLAP